MIFLKQIFERVKQLYPPAARVETPTSQVPDYAQLYAQYIDLIHTRLDRPAGRLLVWVFLGLLGLPLLVQVLFFGGGMKWLVGGLVLIGTGLFGFAYLNLAAQVGWRREAASTSRLAACIAAQLMAAEQRPFSNQQGLIYPDIQHLKQVVQIEQEAAKGRGSAAHLVVLGALLLAGIAWSAVWSVLTIPAPSAALPVPAGWTTFAGLVILVGALGALRRGYAAARDIHNLERANRVLLLACENALSLLEFNQFTYLKEFSFRQKRALAEQLGCRILPVEEAGRKGALLWKAVESASGEAYVLVETAE
jgi:hypothetical protein